MIATQVLAETSDDLEVENDAEVVGFIVIDNKKHEVKKGETKIGRDPSMCSILIENLTVSKVHAVLESDGIDDTFIYDAGSTNQTRLGKKVLKPHCRYKLDNDSNITLGSVLVKFIIPPDKSSNATENCNALDQLGDIFEVATQATAPQSNSLSEVAAFTKETNFSTFKIPKTKTKEPLEPPKSIFDLSTQCRLVSQETSLLKPENAISSHDCSEIFSVSTQCQIYEPQTSKENECETNPVCEVSELKTLLNDGQDEVLCTFMSLHSPKELDSDGVIKKIKTEVENLSQVLDVPTQVESEVAESQEGKGKELNSSLQDKDVSATDSCLPTITSTPLNSRLKLNVPQKDSSPQQIEEDFVKTQEFPVNKLHEKCQTKNFSQDEETQPYLVENLTNTFRTEQRSPDEDFILTQSFETSGKDQFSKEPRIVVPETEDFMETQIYDVEKAKQAVEVVTEMKSPQISETTRDLSQRDVEDDFIATQVFNEATGAKKTVENSEKNEANDEDFIATQVFKEATVAKETVENSEKNETNDEDFIATQVFKEATGAKETVENSEKSKTNDEDFIATQIVEFSDVAQLRKTGNAQETTTAATSRESSPDLLALGSSGKDSEDCISTQIFEPNECHNSKRTLSGFSEKFHSLFLGNLKKDCASTDKIEAPEAAESSGDETESDLEILLDETEIIKKNDETTDSRHKSELESFQNIKGTRISPSQDSNDSYVFEVQPESTSEISEKVQNQRPHLSDSDATDCEEMEILNSKIIIKEEFANQVEFEDTQVLTLTPPSNFVGISDNCTTGEESPKFEIENVNEPWSPLSLEMPSTQDMEASVKRVLRNASENESVVPEKSEYFQASSSKIRKVEVGIEESNESGSFWKIEPSERRVHSPKKRHHDSNDSGVVPVKKFKTEDRLLRSSEKQFSKLVQTHDITQIQPNRTRNSVKNSKADIKPDIPVENNINIIRPTSRRKISAKRGSSKILSSDITSYLIKKEQRSSCGGQKQEVALSKKDSKTVEGSTRVLRSSTRNGQSPNTLVKPPERIASSRQSKRTSRTKKNEYFSSTCVYVAFTGFESTTLDKIISDLGGKKVNDLSGGEVVVADKVRRTVKFLCAIGLSLPITSPEWLVSCKKEKKFLNPWNFILRDEESENKWDFELKTSLEKSKKVKLFNGFNIFATKSTKPPVKDLLAIAKCCGGTPLFEPPAVWPKKTIIVSCLEDKKCWPPAKLRNVQIVHYEFILSGVLRQKVDFKTHRLR